MDGKTLGTAAVLVLMLLSLGIEYWFSRRHRNSNTLFNTRMLFDTVCRLYLGSIS